MNEYSISMLRGSVINIHGINIKPLTLGEIEELGFEKYNSLLNVCTDNKEDYLDSVKNINVDTISMFDILTSNERIKDIFIEFISVFILNDKEINSVQYINATNEIVVIYNGNISRINRRNIDDILYIIKKLYCKNMSSRESDRDDIDDEMKQLLREFEEEERKIRNKKGAIITLNSIIEFVCSKHNSINVFNVWGLTVYQLMITYLRLEKISNYENILNGLYHGSVNFKDIDLERIHWANEIQ